MEITTLGYANKGFFMKVLIWDLPTRLFHWLFAGSILSSFLIAEFAEKETPLFYLHVVFAILASLLLIWRLVWGFVGSQHSRWSEFLFSPKELINYFTSLLTGKGKYYSGHNPAGSYTTLAIMGIAAFTVLSGILITKSELFEELHESLPIVIMVLVGVHIAGVLLASVMHKESYLLSMINGTKTGDSNSAIKKHHYFPALLMIGFVGFGWGYFIKGFDRNSAIFTAPGTQWTYQVGEAEENEGGAEDNENGNEDDDNESLNNSSNNTLDQKNKTYDIQNIPNAEDESGELDKDGDDD